MDHNPNAQPVTVKALYDYKAERGDELSFCKHAIITNVIRLESGGGWWRGDYGGKKQHWFPANFVDEFEGPDNSDKSSELSQPFGNLQKGSINIVGCSVVALNEISAQSEAEKLDWIAKIRETSQHVNDIIRQNQEMEKSLRIAQELSNLIIYCRAVQFVPNKAGHFTEMSSFPESKVEKFLSPNNSQVKLIKHNETQFTRVYPKGGRIDSSNYDPMKMWLNGIQMAALNYQTPDRAMQLNGAKFRQNGRSGYVLRSDLMFDEHFNPCDRTSLKGVLGARHLMKSGRGIICPLVEVEIVGTDYDAHKQKTTTIPDNGFNPVWNQTFVFDIDCPDLAFLRFAVYDEDMFGDPNFLGHGTYPIKCLRTGYRSVPLKNDYSEELELSSLLVHINIKTIRSEDPIYCSIQELRDSSRNLNKMIAEAERIGDSSKAQNFRTQLGRIEEQLIKTNQERMKSSTNGSL
ncbi:unnamed protein product [Medioppia subpectinata]|uniref:Phosphoinositide phospholipase C n=1 Tax=Medioppia subpectinata TaxID=1979941 RepID=A0A7R9Q599_9ACAR|nr:unnamed protein product [Medioppia subpectinata]CAG2112534.1 unnamed protein product [Medioppia subpectinata]